MIATKDRLLFCGQQNRRKMLMHHRASFSGQEIAKRCLVHGLSFLTCITFTNGMKRMMMIMMT